MDIHNGLKFHTQIDLNIIHTFDKMKLNFDDIKNTLKYETYLNLINILKSIQSSEPKIIELFEEIIKE